jgi:hypothetical protein
MAAITTPVAILLLAVAGFVVICRRWSRDSLVLSERSSVDMLVVLNAVATIGAVTLPTVPKYGGVKLFLPFFPFLAILAGVGFDAAADAACRLLRMPAGGRAILTAVSLGGLVSTMAMTIVRIHPYELSYYNAFIGGLPGAARHGFEIQYYDLWYLELARWMNNAFPGGVRVFFQPNNVEYLRQVGWYYDTGRLNRNVVIVQNESEADIIVLTHEMRWPQYPALKERLKSHRALHELAVERVPLLTVYAAHD